MKINALKIGAQALASVVLGGALVYYNFIDKTVEVDSNKCPDFTIATYESNGEQFVISSEKFTLSNHLGKVIILNFWATNCDPCTEEIPHFNTFYENYKEKVEVVIINSQYSYTAQELLDKHMNNPQSAKYEASYSKWLNYTCTFGRTEADNDLLSKFDVIPALPVTVIVDKEGEISYCEAGKLSYERLTELVTPLF